MVPQLPTDNLYKFATLGGILIMGFCHWTTRENSNLVDAQVIKFSQASGNFELIRQELEDDQKQVGNQLTRVEGLVEEALKPENAAKVAQAKNAVEAFTQLKAAVNATRQKSNDLKKARADTDNQTTEMRLLRERLERDAKFTGWLFVWGAFMALSGMSAWYWRHQRFQDELLIVQLENARKQSTSVVEKPAPEETDQPALT